MNTLRFVFILTAVISCLSAQNAQGQSAATNDATTPALRAVNATTAVVIEVEPNRLGSPDWLHNVVRNRIVELVVNGAGSANFYAMIDIPTSSAQPIIRLLIPATTTAEVTAAKGQLAQLSDHDPIAEDGFVVASLTFDVTHGVKNPNFAIDESVLSVDRDRFGLAARAVAQFPIRFLIVPPAHVWETYDELLLELPRKLGGGPVSIVTRGMEWAACGIDLQQATIVATIQSQDRAAAEALAKRIPVMWDRLREEFPSSDAKSSGDALDAIARLARVEVSNDQIRITIGVRDDESPGKFFATILAETSGPIASNRRKSQMRQIVLGMLNYESVHGCFPPVARFRGADGTSGLSWRVHILPFIDELELYQRFQLDEPWDSAHNIKLVERMPDIYNAFSKSRFLDPVGKPGYTTFLAPAGENTILGGREVTKVRHIKDGTSKTAVLVEVKSADAVPWTAPQDYAFVLEDPGAGLAWDRNDQVGIGFCDGHWRLFAKSTPKETLRRLFIMNDGQAIELP